MLYCAFCEALPHALCRPFPVAPIYIAVQVLTHQRVIQRRIEDHLLILVPPPICYPAPTHRSKPRVPFCARHQMSFPPDSPPANSLRHSLAHIRNANPYPDTPRTLKYPVPPIRPNLFLAEQIPWCRRSSHPAPHLSPAVTVESCHVPVLKKVHRNALQNTACSNSAGRRADISAKIPAVCYDPEIVRFAVSIFTSRRSPRFGIRTPHEHTPPALPFWDKKSSRSGAQVVVTPSHVIVSVTCNSPLWLSRFMGKRASVDLRARSSAGEMSPHPHRALTEYRRSPPRATRAHQMRQ